MLMNPKSQSFDYISRYSRCLYYYDNIDQKSVNAIPSWLKDDTPYILYRTQKGDTWESIAFKYYANPIYYWVILDANRLLDPFDAVPSDVEIKVPILSNIEFQ